VTDLATRYGTGRRSRRPLLVAASAVLAAVFLGWLVWVILYHGRPLVQSELVTYDVRGQHAAEARVTVVRRSADVEASCLLRASASDHSVVGELSFPVGPSVPETATLTRVVRTEREATSVELLGCVAEGQAQRR